LPPRTTTCGCPRRPKDPERFARAWAGDSIDEQRRLTEKRHVQGAEGFHPPHVATNLENHWPVSRLEGGHDCESRLRERQTDHATDCERVHMSSPAHGWATTDVPAAPPWLNCRSARMWRNW
jgi:hypothetical protein